MDRALGQRARRFALRAALNSSMTASRLGVAAATRSGSPARHAVLSATASPLSSAFRISAHGLAKRWCAACLLTP